MQTHRQPCQICGGTGGCPECGMPGLACDLCDGRNTCGSCGGAGTEIVAVDTVPREVSADPRAWRRADLFDLDLSVDPDVAALMSTLDPAVRQQPDRLRAIEERMLQWHQAHVERAPRVGDRYLAVGVTLRARSGEPCFCRVEPVSDRKLDTVVVELNLVRAIHLRSHVGVAALVEVHAVHRLAELARRMTGLPEARPADGLTYRLIEGQPVHRADAGSITVLSQSGQEMEHLVALQRDPIGTWRLLLQWEHIGYRRIGVLGDRLLTAADVAAFGLDFCGRMPG